MRARTVAVMLALAFTSACAGGAAGPAGPPGAVPPPPYAGAAPDGQWVETQQYGWVWMPYSDQFMYVPPEGVGEPLEYVYYPAQSGWVWVAAPWVWGVGPWPSFGRRGPDRFAWYGYGWWRTPRRWAYRPAPEPRDRGYAHGVRPAPPMAGPQRMRPAPAPAPQARSAPAPQPMRPAPAPQARSAPAPAPRPEGDRRGGDGRRGKKRGERPRAEGERGRSDGDREAR